MKQTRLFLRLAAALALLYCAGHTSGIPWTPGQTEDANEVVSAMKTATFETAGVNRTYWDFYYGFGVVISAYLLTRSVALWQLASVARTRPALARPVMITMIVSFIINAWFSWKYFFSLPATFAVTISLLILAAFIVSGREQKKILTN